MNTKKIDIRHADENDIAWLLAGGEHISGARLREVIAAEHVYAAESGGTPVGWLRYGLLWDEYPFLNMLFVIPPHRGCGCGTLLIRRWEDDMRALGHRALMTSTPADETSQRFYYGLGFSAAGGFFPPGEPYELMLVKTLHERRD